MATKTFTTRVIVWATVVVALPLLSSCAFLIEVVSWEDGVNVLTNGGFEDGTQPGGPFKPNGAGIMLVPSGSTTMPGWTVLGNPSSSQAVNWYQTGNSFGLTTTDGSHALDLTGSLKKPDGNGHFAGVTQSFPTTVRTRYQLSFDIGVVNGEPIKVTAGLSNGNEANYIETTCPSDSAKQWTPCVLPFTATSANTTLKIFGAQGKNYIGLDNVKVECVAPLGRHDFCNPGPLGQ